MTAMTGIMELAQLFTVWGLGVGGGAEIFTIAATGPAQRCPLRRLRVGSLASRPQSAAVRSQGRLRG